MTEKTCVESLRLLADYWTLRIIDALSDGQELRYCELQRAVDDLNPVTLTSRLKRLESACLLERYEETRDKISVTYRLTERGKEALPILQAVNRFSARSAGA